MPHDFSGMVTEKMFCGFFTNVVALSANADGHVTSALTKHSYIKYDYQTGEYVTEKRNGF